MKNSVVVRLSIACVGTLLSLGTADSAARGVVLTFDDHHLQDWNRIRPLLAELDVKATFFISEYHTLNSLERGIARALQSDGHEIAAHSKDHANAQTYCPNAAENCAISADERADAYIAEQILPQLKTFAEDGIYPQNFAYPYGADHARTTELLRTHFDLVRDTSYFPRHESSYVSCTDDRFIAGLGLDYRYGLTVDDYSIAFDSAVAAGRPLVLYAHRTVPISSDYFVDDHRLRTIIELAQSKGLRFRRLKDVCGWQAFSYGESWQELHASARMPSDIKFADFNGDGVDDGFRTNGATWEVLLSKNGRWNPSSHWQKLNRSSYNAEQLKLGDFDGNGKADVFLASGENWYISYDGKTDWIRVRSSQETLPGLNFGDFNGDGKLDVFFATGKHWLVSLSAKDDWVKINSSSFQHDRVRIGNFDGDDKADVFVTYAGNWFVSHGGTSSWTRINRSTFTTNQVVLTDIDGDNRTDVVRMNGNRWYVSLGGSSDWQEFNRSDETLESITFADIDGDNAYEALRIAENPFH